MLKNLHLIALVAGSAILLPAQHITVLASGLKNPSKIVRLASGSLLVTEVDVTPNSGRVTLISSGGTTRPLISGLPSGLAAPGADADGPNGIVVAGRTLYVAIGEGDGFVNGPKPGQLVPNPQGISSPIFASILKLTLSTDVEQVSGTFALSAQDQSNLAFGRQVALSDGSGSTATAEILTSFRQGIPDPNTIWRNSHPYAMTSLDAQASTLYVADAGLNTVWQVDTSTGRSKALAQFPPTPNPVAGPPPVIEPVPSGIRAYNGQLLVTLLSGAPFVPGQSRVVLVDPVSGSQGIFIALLSSAIDTAYIPRADARPVFYVLQYSASLSAGAPGQLIRYDSVSGKIYVTNLKGPTSMALDPVSDTVYISERTAGDIVVVTP